MENELTNMNIVETQIVVTEPPASSEAVASGEKVEGHIDEPPKLTAEEEAAIARLKKIKEDTRYWQEQKARARGDYFKAVKPDEEKKPAAPVEDLGIGPEPKLDDFPDFEKYNDAKIRYEVTKARIVWDRDQAKKQNESAQQEKMAVLQAKIQRGYEKYPDFDEVVMDQTVPITPVVMDILAECDAPEDVAYYLGRNRAEAIKISRMTPAGAAREIAKIEIEVAKNANKPAAKKVSNAPPPINPLNQGGPAVEKDPEKMTQKEFEAHRAAQGARRF